MRKVRDPPRKTMNMTINMNFKDARAKAKAIVHKQKQIKSGQRQKVQPKQIKVEVNSLPKLQKSAEVNEEHISAYMKALRKTNQEIGYAQLEDTLEKKAKAKEDKKFGNVNFLREKLTSPVKDHAVRRKVKAMRQQRVFPQPKSYMNHRKSKGIFKKNSIKTS